MVRAGSHTLGDSFFRTRLLGISLDLCLSVVTHAKPGGDAGSRGDGPGDVRRIENSEAGVVLVICHVEITLEVVGFGVSDICAVQK